ncbi:hypothetical protein BD289DRAFT_5300 [Coniella lustricola]|uniref:Uncharacterized protein n=1 Tax=Coniella lustricola TaxID=2025994 RepID=A0A2T3ANW4_9PEZI|nr:hypothetical protein BD289DRAFT_5300 [Coniella lustricola]
MTMIVSAHNVGGLRSNIAPTRSLFSKARAKFLLVHAVLVGRCNAAAIAGLGRASCTVISVTKSTFVIRTTKYVS